MGWIISLLIAGGAWLGISRGIYQIAQSPEAIALLPPAEPPPAPPPEYRLPHQWGGPPPAELDPPLHPGELDPYGELGSFREVTPTSPAAGKQITAPGSRLRVISEPKGDHPHHRTITDLILAAPYPSTGPISPDENRLFDALKNERRKQTEIIELIWGCKKGGTDAYNRARERYMMLAESWHNTRKIMEA